MGLALLATKFYMPPVRPNVVVRPRLRERLAAGWRSGRFLTLISAPAGYGKTTLAAGWLQGAVAASVSAPARTAWLSLDEDDNEPVRFFAYLTMALQSIDLTPWPDGQPPWQAGTLPPVEGLMTPLLNAAGALAEPRCLVLDDLHKVRDPFIHEALQFWLDHAPPQLHLVLVSREDPPLTLSRWRVRGQMTEIRAADLRFTAAEAAAFLNQTMGLDLSAEDVAALERRTEGWIAGLQLAAIALQSPQADTADFIATFSGSHHYVIDYLVEEVLRQQPEPVRDFLRQTAVLDRLNPALCDAVTGRSDGAEMLARLARGNLFLVPLDERRRWFRYHHLLADSLRAGLDLAVQVASHRRAAAWCEANGWPVAAVRHALATGDLELAADVMARVIAQAAAWSRGDVARLTGWLEVLPAPLLQARPSLSLHASRALYLAGDLARAEQLLAQAQAALQETPAANERVGLPALTAVYRAAISAMRGENLQAAADAAERVLGMETAVVDRHTAARAADTLGLARELLGDMAAAERAYLQASELAQAAGVSYLAVNARCEAALVQVQQGRLALAKSTCRTALALTADDIPPTGLAHAVLGEIAREQNDLEAAERHLTEGIARSRQGGISDDLRHSYLFLARLRQAQGDAEAALAAWQRADLILQGYGVARLTAWSAAERARLDLAQGNVAAAERWARAFGVQRAAREPEFLQEVETLMAARILLACGDGQGALEMLAPLLAAAEAAGRYRTVIEGSIWRTAALHALGHADGAREALATALALAAPEGFVRLFLLGGTAVAKTLPEVRGAAPAFVDGLLAAFVDGEKDVGGTAVAPSPGHLLEPLTEQEQVVLNLLVAGLSNREIGEELVITVGTVKWHVHNIYQKLDVGSRAEAIARVHKWRLVS